MTPVEVPPDKDWAGLGPPNSLRALLGQRYSCRLGHCGLHSPVDFDGSFWLVVAQTADADGTSINERPGTMTLLDDDLAEFRAGPFVARLRRLTTETWPWHYCW